jgi:hypothetical protein
MILLSGKRDSKLQALLASNNKSRPLKKALLDLFSITGPTADYTAFNLSFFEGGRMNRGGCLKFSQEPLFSIDVIRS